MKANICIVVISLGIGIAALIYDHNQPIPITLNNGTKTTATRAEIAAWLLYDRKTDTYEVLTLQDDSDDGHRRLLHTFHFGARHPEQPAVH